MAIVKTSAERYAELEASLAAIENKAADDAADPVNKSETNMSQEEITFKKRYSDLRSHTSRLENDLRREINGLKDQLTQATKKTMDFPKSAEEVNAWANKYPEIYDTIVTIARKNAIDVAKDTETKVQAIEQREFESTKRRAYLELVDAHKDFPDIATSQDFIDWVETQPRYIYDALYVNETDAASAIRAVDLYKADRGTFKKNEVKEKKNDDTRDAARQVPKGQSSAPNSGNAPKWTESKLQGVNWNRLTPEQIEEIDRDSQNPEFYDVSGGAR